MVSNKYTSLVMLFLLLFQFSFYVTSIRVQGEQPNLLVHVSAIETFANGTFTKMNAFPANVTIIQLGDNFSESILTDPNGFARFYIPRAGTFLINITFGNYIFEPYSFYHDGVSSMTIYENVYKLARFFSGDQNTLFKLIKISLPGSVTLTYPKSNINVTVDSYGLRWQAKKSETQFTFTPLDYSEPVYDESGLLVLYPNYTVTVCLTTLEEGELGLMVVDNATIKFYATPNYRVPKGANIEFKFVLFVIRPPIIERITKFEKKLDTILSILMTIQKILNDTVVPLLNTIRNGTLSAVDRATEKISRLINSTTATTSSALEKLNNAFNDFTSGYNMSMIWKKLSDISTGIQYIRENIGHISTEVKYRVRSILEEKLGGYMSNLYTVTGVIIIASIIAVGSIFVKKGRKTEEPEFVISG